MKLANKTYEKLKSHLLHTNFITFYGFRIRKILGIIFKYYLPGVSLSIFSFALIYYFDHGLLFANHKEQIMTFLDCFYFSTISFFTVGYGDIYPYSHLSKIAVILQQFLSFITLTLFSGFIIPIFFVRRNDVSFCDALTICYNEDAYTLTFPIFNKGAMFYEMQGALSLTFSNRRNIVSRYSLIHSYTTWFKEFWFCDFEISIENAQDENYMVLYEMLYLAMTGQISKLKLPKLKLCIHGIDSQTRGVAYFIQEYYINGISLTFSSKADPSLFLNKKHIAKWKECFVEMKDHEFIQFFKLFQSILFPHNEPTRASATGLFEIENMGIHQTLRQCKKKIQIP